MNEQVTRIPVGDPSPYEVLVGRGLLGELTAMLAGQQTYTPNVEALMSSQTTLGVALHPMLSGYVE